MMKIFFLLATLFFASCQGQSKTENTSNDVSKSQEIPTFGTNVFNPSLILDKNIRSIFEDQKGNFWFGTNGAGVYSYDGKTLKQYTEKDGLANNQVQSIQEDKSGNLWFGTGIFGVSRFDGQKFTTFSSKENLVFDKEKSWKIESNDLWFFAGGGAYRYNGNSLEYLPLDKSITDSKSAQNAPTNLSRFGVYSILKDKKGNLWFGTQAEGVCRFDGKTFTWFTEKGLAGPAVLGLFEDKNGNIWMGNNGAGLFRYDGKTLVNFTEEKGLGNKEFRAAGKAALGTMARIYAINEDKKGDLWIGTVDAGLWRYDGKTLTNYNTKEGLTSNAINTIYKDKKGELWFGTDTEGICKFNGKTFYRFEPK
ncbi:hypothetical protein EGI26_06365 [Lacihabitans sp. CCS-44]|uniref:ligand-binding sensor domain-containing protein n=2 Tax=Lacihabitans sp. CCS-44 TaxID=2487331 RepID=UPI0020CC41BA|nr:two-component regulator propeller domain-containing protein [Lacihabitans sp. CCS-44]MCP9754784.1 hypothetical protein [Lacihabitans sp. CCS-44]